MRVIHVLRKPLSEGTVASNVLKHGTGGLNIDASRIESHGDRANESGGGAGAGQYDDGVRSRTEERTYGGTLGGRVADPHPGGRWPANVILQHLDGCWCDGVKRVSTGYWGKPTRGATPKGSRAAYSDGLDGTRESVGYGDSDNKETVADWICEPGCPVARLDEQSGVRAKGNFPSQQNTASWKMSSKGKHLTPEIDYGDTGGASRFYKQVGGKSDG